MDNENLHLPRHIGIIMDGNGRWATMRNKNRSFGHKAGSENVDRIVSYAFSRGIYALTLYTFSSENWQRPKAEVDELMKLLSIYIKTFTKKLIKNKVKFLVIGDIDGLSSELSSLIYSSMEKTCNFSEHVLCLAINYGGRQEIVHAVNSLLLDKKEVTLDNISSYLYTANIGEPDLIIRTGGELRLSNFLLYQGAYAELYFCDTLWPDFDEKTFDEAIISFSNRKRRFGKI